MQHVNWYIDFVQTSKKQFVDNTVSNDVIRRGLHDFVEKQTILCKTITKNIEIFTKELLDTTFKSK